MTDFEQVRRSYRPEVVKFALVAEAPPSKESGRFFYFENVPTGDSLFLEVMKSLYPRTCIDVKQIRASKPGLLRRFREDGFYLLDACPDPIDGKGRPLKIRCLRAGLDHLLSSLKGIRNPSMKVVLISATVYEVCCLPLRQTGYDVINTEMIDFPGSGRQKEFQRKFRRLMQGNGWCGSG